MLSICIFCPRFAMSISSLNKTSDRLEKLIRGSGPKIIIVDENMMAKIGE